MYFTENNLTFYHGNVQIIRWYNFTAIIGAKKIFSTIKVWNAREFYIKELASRKQLPV